MIAILWHSLIFFFKLVLYFMSLQVCVEAGHSDSRLHAESSDRHISEKIFQHHSRFCIQPPDVGIYAYLRKNAINKFQDSGRSIAYLHITLLLRTRGYRVTHR